MPVSFTLSDIAPRNIAQLPPHFFSHSPYKQAFKAGDKPLGYRLYEDNTFQKTVPLRNCAIKFVDSSGDEIAQYNDLPEFELAEEEREIIAGLASKLKFNGHNLLIQDLHFDEVTNTLFVQPVRARYAVLQALTRGDIKRDQFYFKTGTISPIIAQPDEAGQAPSTFLMKRRVDGYLSAPAGFAQPLVSPGDHMAAVDPFLDYLSYTSAHEGADEVSFEPLKKELGGKSYDLFRLTAMKEAAEELLHQADPSLRPSALKLGDVTMSIRYTTGSTMPTIEFVMPIKVDLTASQVRKMMTNNTAPDANEHTEEYVEIRDSASLKAHLGSNATGGFLHAPTLFGVSGKLHDKFKENLAQSKGVIAAASL